MEKITGNLQKMKTRLSAPVHYCLVFGDSEIKLNSLLGKQINFEFTGQINCIHCDRKINKSFQQGYCFPCLRRLQECNLCIIHPERCQVEQGTCPKDDWAHAQCYQQHVVYLANSSNLKVGITRHTQVPTRWIDQGASQALPIFKVKNRYQAGAIEVALKKHVADKTNWRTMLKQSAEDLDLLICRDQLVAIAKQDLDKAKKEFAAGDICACEDEGIVEICYPVVEYPLKISSLSLDKTPEVGGKLQGIKGQYLIFDKGVMNVRKFGGYQVNFSVS